MKAARNECLRGIAYTFSVSLFRQESSSSVPDVLNYLTLMRPPTLNLQIQSSDLL